MDQTKLRELVMYALGKAQPQVSDAQAVAIGEQLIMEILALVPPPAPTP